MSMQQLSGMTRDQLVALARARGLKHSGLRKAELQAELAGGGSLYASSVSYSAPRGRSARSRSPSPSRRSRSPSPALSSAMSRMNLNAS